MSIFRVTGNRTVHGLWPVDQNHAPRFRLRSICAILRARLALSIRCRSVGWIADNSKNSQTKSPIDTECFKRLARSPGEELGRPSFPKAPADHSAVWEMHDQFDAAILRHRLCCKFCCFSGGVVAEFVVNIGADDPVVESVVGNNMNGAIRHGLNFPEV